MLHDAFRSFSGGRISRMRFVVTTLALALAVIVVGLAMGAGAGVLERLAGTEAVHASAPALGGGGLLLFLLTGGLAILGTLNLVAKRARDIGWGVPLALLLFILFSGITWIVLAVVPGKPTDPDWQDSRDTP